MDDAVHIRREKAGLPPGTLLPVGERRVERTTLTLIEYNAGACSERVLADSEDWRSLNNASAVHWINVEGLHDVAPAPRRSSSGGLRRGHDPA